MANDHYVSQFYLRRFWFINPNSPDNPSLSESEKDFMTYVYYLDKSICKGKGLQNIASKWSLFDPEIETAFSQFEGKFNTLINKLESNIAHIRKHKRIETVITPDDIFLLVKFIDFQYRRSAVVHPAISSSLEETRKHIIKQVEDEIWIPDWLMPKVHETLTTAGMYRQTVDTVSKRFFKEHSTEETTKLEQILLARDWYIFFIDSSKPCEFISCDFPVYRFNPNWGNGLVFDSTELIFPLTPDILLVNIGTKRGGIFEYKAVNRDDVKKANRMIASNAINEIYWRNQKLIESLGKYRQSPSRKYEPNIPFNPQWVGLMKDEADAILQSHKLLNHYPDKTM